MPTAARVGFVDRHTGTQSARIEAIAQAIRAWAVERGIDAVVWTDLAPNFSEKTGKRFTMEAAGEYLRSLSSEQLDDAVKYIRNAPTGIDTPVRQYLQEVGLI